jgi:hypothetical protein
MDNVLAKLTQLLDVNVIKLLQDIMTFLIQNLVNVMRMDLLVLNAMNQAENVHAKKMSLEINVPNVLLNSGEALQIAKLACVILRVLKIIFAMLILATVIVKEASKVIIVINVSKDTLDSLLVKPAVVTKKALLVTLVIMRPEPAPADPTLPDIDVINVPLDILDSQTVNLVCVMMMAQEISLVMTTLENVLVELM